MFTSGVSGMGADATMLADKNATVAAVKIFKPNNLSDLCSIA